MKSKNAPTCHHCVSVRQYYSAVQHAACRLHAPSRKVFAALSHLSSFNNTLFTHII